MARSSGPWRHAHPQRLALLRQFLAREVSGRYLGSVGSVLWVLTQPLAQLAVYSLVFTTIFKVRFPALEQHAFVVFVALGLWPWLAFQEAVQRGTVAVTAGGGLIKKVAFPQELLVYAATGASFVVHGAGFLFVLLALTAFGADLHLMALPGALAVLVMLLLLAAALALVLAALQVFLKDVEHAIAPAFMLWFYASPILYPLTLVPPPFQRAMQFNPMSYFVERLRDLLMYGRWQPSASDLAALVASVLAFYLARRFFLRCAPRFEEFL